VSKSNPSRLFGNKSVGTVTVLETKVHRSSARNAKFAFILTAVVVGLLTMAVASDRMHPILALFLGVAIGAPTGAVVWALVRVWPVIRLVWWWLPEITLTVGLIYAWVLLARHTPLPVRLVVLALMVGVPTFVGPVRRQVKAWAWCLVVRHRLRTCFAQFITANQSGSLPLIGIARPTPVGERVSIYLRPGLSMADLLNQLDKLAVGCHAATVTVERASTRNAARVRVDTKRREVLNATVASPLVDLIEAGVSTPVKEEPVIPTALDLPDVTTAKPAASTPAPRGNGTGHKSASSAVAANTTNTSNGSGDVDDVSQWI
jgi:hypothetical protein